MYFPKDLKTDYNIEQIVNEAYVGKSKTLLEIEKAIGELRKMIKPNTPDNCKEVLSINRLVEKQFGMHIFALHIDPTSWFSGYTYVLGKYYDFAMGQPWKYVTGDKQNGYRFTDNNKFTIVTYLSYGMLADPQYTDAEIVAIMLHEIGHNFGDCIYDKLYSYNIKLVENYRKALYQLIIFTVILAPFTAGATLLLTAKYVKMYNDFTHGGANKTKTEKKDRKRSQRITKFFQSLTAKKNDKRLENQIKSNRRNPNYPKIIDNAYKQYSDKYKKQIRKSEDRQSEVFADKFAGVYGYSVELSTALSKAERIYTSKSYQIADKAAKGDPYYQQLNDDISEALMKFGDLDVHPELTQRINSNIELLKKEYEKSTIDPAVKKELLQQIKDMEKLINDLTDAQNKIINIDKAQALYNKKINDQLPSAVDEEIENAIDAALDKALEDGEKKDK